MPRVALYHRVSTTDQNPRLARRDLRKWAGRCGFTVALDVEETGSGLRSDRPGLQRVLTAARQGELDAIAVWKLDRFGRSSLDVLASLQTLQDMGIEFYAVSQGLAVKPKGDAMSRMLVQMLAAVAEFERELIAERTRLGLQAARDAGVTLGRPRLDRPSAEDVQRLRDEGQSWEAIATTLKTSVWLCRVVLNEASAKPRRRRQRR